MSRFLLLNIGIHCLILSLCLRLANNHGATGLEPDLRVRGGKRAVHAGAHSLQIAKEKLRQFESARMRGEPIIQARLRDASDLHLMVDAVVLQRDDWFGLLISINNDPRRFFRLKIAANQNVIDGFAIAIMDFEWPRCGHACGDMKLIHLQPKANRRRAMMRR